MAVGKSEKRVDAYDKVTGKAQYTDDLCDRGLTSPVSCKRPLRKERSTPSTPRKPRRSRVWSKF